MSAVAIGEPVDCQLIEGLLAARVAGSISPESDRALDRHFEICDACRLLAREIEDSEVADLLSGIAEAGRDFAELTVVASENYVRGREIGRGGMGRIVRARDRRLGRMVAIKELIDERLRERFQKEARLTARLQHPAIVSVHEAGRWPTGEPFYAMKYVVGRPLDRVIADLGTLDERLALLPSLMTVVDAIAYAHSERVVHRDLKPHNVIIGPFGETVVIDWGLACEIAARPETKGPYRDLGGLLTQAGAGTPEYMPPEQARGEAPDERVDVFALGATLHHVLAGDAPRRRPLPDDTPRELRDIVAKAMTLRPEDRYATAAELAAELRRFQNGQLVSAHRYTARELVRRWLRRHRLAVGFSAVFLVLISAVGAVSMGNIVAASRRAEIAAREAEIQRDEARRSRDAAEALAERMVGELHFQLAAAGKIDLLAGSAQAVVQYHRAAPAGDARSLATLATALGVLTDVEIAHKNLGAALALARMRVDVLRRSPKLDELAEAYASLGSVENELGAGGLPALTTALALAAPAAANAHEGGRSLQILADALAQFGEVAGNLSGNLQLDVDTQAAACRVYERLVASAPDDEALLRALGTRQQHLGVGEVNVGDYEDARATWTANNALYQRLVTRHPGDVALEQKLASSEQFLGFVASHLGDVVASRAGYIQCIERRRRQVAADPDNVSVRIRLGYCLGGLSETEVGDARGAAALRVAREGLANAEELQRAHPAQWVLARNVVFSLQDVGRGLLVSGEPAEARRTLERARALVKEMMAAHPAERRQFLWIAATPEEVDADLALHDVAAARRVAEQNLATTAEALANSPKAGEYVERYGRAGIEVAKAALAAGDAAAATAALGPALASLGELVAEQPAVVNYAVSEADGLVQLGRATGDKRRFGEAVAVLQPFKERHRLPGLYARILDEARRRAR